MGRWEFQGRNGMLVVVESDDDVLDNVAAHHNLELALATAGDQFIPEQMVKSRFSETHDVDHGEADRTLDQIPVVVTVRMRRRSESAD